MTAEDVLYALPLPGELGSLGTAAARQLAAEHLERVRAKHGSVCPNCGNNLDDPDLLIHRALERGICCSLHDEATLQ